jgi:hypothetical protein
LFDFGDTNNEEVFNRPEFAFNQGGADPDSEDEVVEARNDGIIQGGKLQIKGFGEFPDSDSEEENSAIKEDTPIVEQFQQLKVTEPSFELTGANDIKINPSLLQEEEEEPQQFAQPQIERYASETSNSSEESTDHIVSFKF